MCEQKMSRMYRSYHDLKSGHILSKMELAERYGVSEKTVQRDIEALRDLLYEFYPTLELLYDRNERGYRLLDEKGKEKAALLYSVAKVLLESRAFVKEEVSAILDELTARLFVKDREVLCQLLTNDLYHYEELAHGKKITMLVYELAQYVKEQNRIEMTYEEEDGRVVTMPINPLGIVFSDFYFYLIGCTTEHERKGEIVPVAFRVDHIRSFRPLDHRYVYPPSERFEEGAFRKKIQFMKLGESMRVRFRYKGTSMETLLDRMPTAFIVKEEDDECVIIEAEVYGEGIEMWLLSQGSDVEVLEPPELRQSMRRTIQEMYDPYKND